MPPNLVLIFRQVCAVVMDFLQELVQRFLTTVVAVDSLERTLNCFLRSGSHVEQDNPI
jgi:hypothetical protein